MEPACDVNEKGIREKNDGSENMSMDDNENIEADSDKGSFAEEGWNYPEQSEVPKWSEPHMPMTTETRKGERERTGMRYNKYDKIRPEELGEEMVKVRDLVADEEWQIINDGEHSW